MDENILEFPKGFIWGTAVCSHQSDGHNVHSDWWAFEQEGKIADGTVSGAACDIWNKYPEDFEYMRQAGHTGYRMSVEWARVEPRRGEWDEEAIAHTAAMLDALRARGIAVCLTLYHWTLPKWVQDAGGWTNREMVERFGMFAERVVEAMGDRVTAWVTLNEPLVPVTAGFVAGIYPPEKKNLFLAMKVFRNLLRGHAAAAAAIRRRFPDARIGLALSLPYWEALNKDNPIEVKLIDAMRFLHNHAMQDALVSGRVPFPYGTGQTIEGLADSFTYVGVNYYTRFRLRPKLKMPTGLVDLLYIEPGTPKNEMGWENYPPGFHAVLMDMHERYGKPIYITENGVADGTDRMRPHYLLTHLAQMHRAIRDGVDVRGYFQWTLIDNFEWQEGWRPKVGLMAMDPVTLERRPRASAHMFSEIAKANAVTPEIVRKYAPEAMGEIFG